MNRHRITFNENIMLDENFKNFIEEFIEISGYDSVIERKDSDDKNIWNEIYDGDNRKYLIECIMSEDEYKSLKEKEGFNYSLEKIV